MARCFFQNDHAYSLLSVSNEADLRPRPGVSVNPPPPDGRCQGCRRHVQELPPFGKADAPFRGDFEGEVLLKTFRSMAPDDAEAERIVRSFFEACESAEDHERAMERMVQAYGQERAEDLRQWMILASTVEKVWLCRDCLTRE